MRIVNAVLVLAFLGSTSVAAPAQSPANGGPANQPAVQPARSTASTEALQPPPPPSQVLQPSLDEVQQTVSAVRLEKWKRGTVREEAETNIDAILRDLQGTLPALLKEADAAPGTLSRVLPVSRNVDALYDVLVHVVEASRVAAPADQVGQLQAAMDNLEKARVALDTHIQDTAVAQEKQVADLHSTVQAQEKSLRAAAAAPPAPACPAPAPAKKKKPAAKKPATQGTSSTTTNPAAQSSGTTSKPQ